MDGRKVSSTNEREGKISIDVLNAYGTVTTMWKQARADQNGYVKFDKVERRGQIMKR